MDFIQQIKLKNVIANDDAILFKVCVNGEDRIFIGKQNTKFDIAIADNLESHLLSDKLSSNLKLAESFHKAYLVDREVMHKENYKKDVIIPCAVSKEIVQFGNLLYSMSTETNNNVLYLLYKNRLINRYVDDVTHMIYYELSDDIKNKIDNLNPDEILQGGTVSDESIKIFKGLIDNFNTTLTVKNSEGDDDYYNKLVPIEKTCYYQNMEGLIESLEDSINVNSDDITTMPFNLIYEYGEDRQYENEQSNVYADFIHLKNSLSPFFNVEVTEENKFKLWRKYVKIDSSNFKLWTSYTFETPKKVVVEENKNVSALNVGNFVNNAEYYTNVVSFSKTYIDHRLDKNLTHEGFTLHIECPRDQLLSRYMFSYNNRSSAKNNADFNHLTKTSKDFANWLIDKSNGKIQHKYGQISNDTEFTISTIQSLDSNDIIIELECIKDTQISDLTITDHLDIKLPAYVNAFNFNYDKGQIYRKGFKSFVDFEIDHQYKPNGKNRIITYAETINGSNEARSIEGNVYNWTNLYNNNVDTYKDDSFILHYTNGEKESFSKKTVFNSETPDTSKAVDTIEYVDSTSWTMSLINDSNQYQWIQDALYNIGFKNGNFYEKLSDDEWQNLLDKKYNIDDILNSEIANTYTKTKWNSLSTESKIKFLLTKLINNYDSNFEFDSTTVLDGKTFEDIKNVFLCEAVGTTINDAVSCLFYFIENKGVWKKGDKIRFTNYRLSQYETTLFKDDSLNDKNQYYLTDETGQSIKYFSTVFDIRPAINDKNYADEPLTSPNYERSLIDLFGITINGKYVNDYEIIESNVVSHLFKDTSQIFSIDLSVSFKNIYLEDALCINSYINGQLINSTEYNVLSKEYIEFINRLGSISDIRFWCYGENHYMNEIFLSVYPFIFNNISMWNYPLNTSQCQLLRRMSNSKKQLSNYINDLYKSTDNRELEHVQSDTNEDELYGKLFCIESHKLTYDYLFDNKEGVSVNDEKLFKIQDFEFVDRINGLNKLTPTSGRKSNLYSIKISNTGLAIEDDDDDETIKFKQSMNSALIAAVNTICSKTEPLNTKLYSVIIDS